MSALRLEPGTSSPLGATVTPRGVNFAIDSEHAQAIELCLFEQAADSVPHTVLQLPGRSGPVFHGFAADLRSGQVYGYRVYGPPNPPHRFDSSRILLDPYAKMISGDIRWREAQLAGVDIAARELSAAEAARFYPKSIVYADEFAWEGDALLRRSWQDTVLYECHVKGMTMLHPEVPREHRGRYLGMASPVILDHLLGLGVTAVELLPVQQCITERTVAARGLVNYWGYNTIGFFAPDARFSCAAGGQVVEFKQMVKALHSAGIEVILDVAYNHTAEGDETGPTLCFRGLDNAVYYLLDPADPRRYMNFTGCGNTFNAGHPQVRQLILDSLRYWAGVMHVDGFRFDLASALTRQSDGSCGDFELFDMILADPLLRERKLIVEPWDAAPDGYRLGGFPDGFVEWNDRFRDEVRDFWRGQRGGVGRVATRLAGSSDLFSRRRGPMASVNFVTSHDGFTLRDVVSYARKHNHDNGEGNRDGTDANFSSNWGIEGDTDDPGVQEVRERVMKSLMACLAFSRGVPMLSMGDELGRTQGGNNNAYCQDNEVSWVRWDAAPHGLQAASGAGDGARALPERMLEFTRRVFAVRRALAVFRKETFYNGRSSETGRLDIYWLREDGTEMSQADWQDSSRLVLGALMDDGSRLLLLLNAGNKPVCFEQPRGIEPVRWELLVETGPPSTTDRLWMIAPHSLKLLREA